ncbi:MAG: hypothetical protein AAFS12_14025 [Cyanobacteria bacterium J06632_19]
MTRKPYPTDISDVEWDLIKPMIPGEGKRKRGKKREVDMREDFKRRKSRSAEVLKLFGIGMGI